MTKHAAHYVLIRMQTYMAGYCEVLFTNKELLYNETEDAGL